ncbi:hypothetical protein AWM68_13270 [Fictibacillus phosphorivorans]|uniref:Uncharacterized protein n=1 Tax=Fictibacillus phosphorivorans TaxID=1221500 RepID=A0A163PSS8_9BACL|nr:hypothetical protein [Fictibacillus phosphorivorans]KZE64072.1 hypothetical protein AWM68_13270 [Fictibacillus phosphorivorans]
MNKHLYAIFIVLISIFVGIILVWSLKSNIILTGSHVTLILLIAILGLSFSFDKLMLGKLFSIEKKLNEVESQNEDITEQQNEIQKENIKFKEEMFSLMFNSLNQVSNQKNNQSQVVNVLPSSTKEEYEDEVAELQNDEKTQDEGNDKSSQHTTGSEPTNESENKDVSKSHTIMLLRESEHYAIEYVASKMGLTPSEVVPQISMSFSDQLIKGRKRRFDGFMDTPDFHYFFEVLHGPFRHERIDRIYNMVADIKGYSEINRIPTKLILILVNHPDEKFNKNADLEYAREKYISHITPAIENNLINIETCEIDYEKAIDTKHMEVAATKG